MRTCSCRNIGQLCIFIQIYKARNPLVLPSGDLLNLVIAFQELWNAVFCVTIWHQNYIIKQVKSKHTACVQLNVCITAAESLPISCYFLLVASEEAMHSLFWSINGVMWPLCCWEKRWEVLGAIFICTSAFPLLSCMVAFFWFWVLVLIDRNIQSSNEYVHIRAFWIPDHLCWEWCSSNCLAWMQIGSCEGAQGAAAGLSSDNLGSHLLWSSWDPPFISVYNCFFAKLAFNLTVVLAGSFAPPIIPQIMRDPSFPNVLFRGRDSFLHEFFKS